MQERYLVAFEPYRSEVDEGAVVSFKNYRTFVTAKEQRSVALPFETWASEPI